MLKETAENQTVSCTSLWLKNKNNIELPAICATLPDDWLKDVIFNFDSLNFCSFFYF